MYDFGQEEMQAAARVLASRRLFRYLPGEHEADRFESELGARFGRRHAVLVSSGTAALICSLAALGIGPDDEVLVPAYGFIADPLAVLAVGAVPVICEIDETLTLDPADVKARIGPRTRAILPIHMNGFPCDMDALGEIAYTHSLHVVEDACQAIGGTYRGRMIGAIGDVAAFSFNQHKILTAGEGGAVLTDRRDLYERAFISHDGSCGSSPFRFQEPLFAGLAFRASEITAAILRAQLVKLDRILEGLRSWRDRAVEILGSGTRLRRVPCHDPEGECGTHVAYAFDSVEAAEEFQRIAEGAGLDVTRGNTYWHSYQEWTLVHERRGAHDPRADPLQRTERGFLPSECPRTRRVLDRTRLVNCGASATDAALAEARERLVASGL